MLYYMQPLCNLRLLVLTRHIGQHLCLLTLLFRQCLSKANGISALVRFAQPYDSKSRPSGIIFHLSLTGLDPAVFATLGLYKATAPQC